VSPRKEHHAWGPCHARHSTPCPGSVSKVIVGVVSKDVPLPQISTNHQAVAVGQLRLFASPSHLATAAKSSKIGKSLVPSSDVVPHRVPPAMLSNPSQSAASPVVERCRCRKHRPPTQAHAALTVARQCQPSQSTASSQPATRRQPLAATKSVIASAKARRHPSSLPQGRDVDPD
jgi:hypothetical protein